MKKTALFFLIPLFFTSIIFANGVGVVDATNGVYLKLTSSKVEVKVNNQVAIIKSTQKFLNNLGSSKVFKYAFPLNEDESAIGLRWKINGEWFNAEISPTPQDTTLPGSGGIIHQNLKNYLGETPLYFRIDSPLQNDSLVTVELTYVSLLPYKFGNVNFSYPNDYSLLLNSPIGIQQIKFHLQSERTINNLSLLNQSPDSIYNDGNDAYLEYSLENNIAENDYNVKYSLSLEELGLFGLSTFLADSLVPDEQDNGFFVFVAEPDPGNQTDIIQKVFTLIIDRSGSMIGTKIVQARNAAKFIVNNLNEGDKFNIVDFSGLASKFREQHVEFNSTTQSDALGYIAQIVANGWTNISDAFGTAIPQFSTASDSTANIIIFFTDGQATGGITNTEAILEHIRNLVISAETNLSIFTFGIGNDVNQQLLTLIAQQNSGLSEFLGNDELEDKITEFYLKIRNPVLLNTNISFSPEIVIQTFPNPAPDLYKGIQMIISGRYSNPQPVEVTLSGTAFGQPVNYIYSLNLSDTASTGNQFLTKIWAKKKIEDLIIQYYGLDPNSNTAQEIKDQIINLSQLFGVITPFTSFTGHITTVEEDENSKEESITPSKFALLGNYPNPFNPGTTIKFQVGENSTNSIFIRIYNSIGQLVKTIVKPVQGRGTYTVYWNGILTNGETAPSGIYFYIVDFGNTLLSGKMILLK